MDPSESIKAARKALKRGDEANFKMICVSILKFHPGSPEASEAKRMLESRISNAHGDTPDNADELVVDSVKNTGSGLMNGFITFVVTLVVGYVLFRLGAEWAEMELLQILLMGFGGFIMLAGVIGLLVVFSELFHIPSAIMAYIVGAVIVYVLLMILSPYFWLLQPLFPWLY